jgi:hypothetical protein
MTADEGARAPEDDAAMRPASPAAGARQPGERRPAEATPAGSDTRTGLPIPPSARYARRDAEAGRPGGAPTGFRERVRGSILGAIGIAAAGALVLTGLMGLLTATTGTILVAAVVGAAIGLVLAGAAVTAGPGTGPALSRPGAVRLAAVLAIAMVGATALGVWFVARMQGGVLDPVSHAWTVYGFGFPAMAAAAAITAAWGAANGPVRG